MCHYYLLHCPKLRLLSDNSGLIQMLQKDICSIRNPRHHRILTSLQHLVFHEVVHIPGQLNVLADALSRLTRFMRMEGEELSVMKPRILGLSSNRARRAKELHKEDPLVLNMAQVGSLDTSYLEMMKLVEDRVQPKNLPMESELKQIEGSLSELRVVEMSTGDRLLCKGEAVYVPASLRTQMVDTLHLTHAADQSMLESAKNRIYWPGLRKQLHVKYQTCKECSYNRISQTRPANECSQSNLFENFFPTVTSRQISYNLMTQI